MTTGLGGRSLVTLTRHNETQLPGNSETTRVDSDVAHRFTSGDIVAVAPASASTEERKQAPQGVVYKTTQISLTVAYDDLPEELQAASGNLTVYLCVIEC